MIARALLVSVAFALAPSDSASANGTAADLDGIPPIGWPLGVPMTCLELSEGMTRKLYDAVEKLRAHCNEQNLQMRAAGFPACAFNECMDSTLSTARGEDFGAVRLRMGRSEWTDDYYITLNYTFPGIKTPQAVPNLVCFDPEQRAQELLRTELDTWDFQRFVDFCIKKN